MTTATIQQGDPAATTPATGADASAAVQAGQAAAAAQAPAAAVSATPAAKAAESAAAAKPAEAQKPAAATVYQFKVPDGIVVPPERLAAFSTLAQEVGIDQDAAQRLVDFQAAQAAADDRAAKAAWEKTVEGWQQTNAQDPKFTETLGLAKRTVALMPDEVKTLLVQGGLEHHPGLIRWLAGIGKQLSDSPPADRGGRAAAGSKKTLADVLYDHPTSQK